MLSPGSFEGMLHTFLPEMKLNSISIRNESGYAQSCCGMQPIIVTLSDSRQTIPPRKSARQLNLTFCLCHKEKNERIELPLLQNVARMLALRNE